MILFIPFTKTMIELGIGLIELGIGLIELGIGLIELRKGLMELGIGLRIITPGAPSWPVYPALFCCVPLLILLPLSSTHSVSHSLLW